jgi:Ala-tRNA(Pro) deacylase
MAISKKLKEILEEKGVQYEAEEHPAAYTAQEIAGAQHVPGDRLLKSVIVRKEDGEYIMVVLPSTRLVDFDKLSALTKDKKLELANEDELGKLFPDYELGAEPPFGNLYGLKVYADRSIEESDEVYFNGGSHTDTVKMELSDYIDITQPIMGDIGRHI